MYRNGEICGVCIQLWCVDSVCEDTLVRNATFMIVDSCQDCKANNIVVSGLGAANLTGELPAQAAWVAGCWAGGPPALVLPGRHAGCGAGRCRARVPVRAL